ncbi:lipid A biosynthesis lauroyl acyltransferase [Campylobacter mucosalis]|uniref:lipid A biosynthesis lauroyl acyltransferase n=1 Tax=Campylobacter mucosalis TaxID=202 RepID=UPI0014703CEA|nr:lipid A biosynthesis lauroyl acyltransferase [Campylobacter mucosalis]
MDKLYLILFYIFKFIITITPNSVHNAIVKFLVFVYMRLNKKRFKVVMTNLNLAFGDEISMQKKLEIAKKCYINFAKFLGINFIKNQNTTRDRVLNRVKFNGLDYVNQAIKEGRAIIMQGAHCGEWELIALALGAKFGKCSVVGRTLDSKIMQKILEKNRSQFDMQIIDKMGGMKQILKALKDGRILGILVDQNTKKSEGVEVNFFGKRVLHTPAASIVAQKMDALIIPTFIKSIDDENREICILEPIDPRNFATLKKNEAILKMTQAQADITEAFVRQNVDEYFWFHKRFKHFYEESYE